MFSANFELYGDISERITTQLTSITPHIEVYSVDEAFLDLSELDIADYQAWGRQVRATILQNIGIPVSIGLAHTKTLCKLANHTAKKDPRFQGALLLGKHQISSPTSQIGAWSLALSSTPIEDVWGVGWRLAPRLRAEGVFTALDLARLRPQRAQQLMGIHGRHLVYELGGTRCLPLQQTTKPQRVVARGRQFGADTSEPHVLEAAITSLAARAAHKLRRDGQLACRAGVILQTNRHKPGYTRSFTPAVFYTPTADTGTICSQLVRLVARDLKPRLSYHKAEVVLYDLVPSHALQTDVFGAVNLDAHARNQRRMQATDAINTAYGPHTIGPAAELLSNAWQPKSAMRSPRYTSHWPDLPVVVAMQQQ